MWTSKWFVEIPYDSENMLTFLFEVIALPEVGMSGLQLIHKTCNNVIDLKEQAKEW